MECFSVAIGFSPKDPLSETVKKYALSPIKHKPIFLRL